LNVANKAHLHLSQVTKAVLAVMQIDLFGIKA
jgi:hypothetical protein